MDTRRDVAEALITRLDAMVDGPYLKIRRSVDGRHIVNKAAWATFSGGLEQLDETLIDLGEDGHGVRDLIARRDELAEFYQWSLERRQALIVDRLEDILGDAA